MCTGDPELPTPTRERLQNAVELGLAERFNPWDHYVLPLLEMTPGILEANPEVTVRVYFAKDLEFLAEELAEGGNEVYLMKSSSINFAPGNASSQLLTLDIEYCTWGNPASEVAYFPSGSCCGQLPESAEASEQPELTAKTSPS